MSEAVMNVHSVMNQAERVCQQIASQATAGVQLVDVEEDRWVAEETTDETCDRVWPDSDEPMGAEEATERSERRLPALREPVANYRVAGQALERVEQRLLALNEPTDTEKAIERNQPTDEGMGVQDEALPYNDEPAHRPTWSWHDNMPKKPATKKQARWADESESKQPFKWGPEPVKSSMKKKMPGDADAPDDDGASTCAPSTGARSVKTAASAKSSLSHGSAGLSVVSTGGPRVRDDSPASDDSGKLTNFTTTSMNSCKPASKRGPKRKAKAEARAKANAIAKGYVWQDKEEYKRPSVYRNGEEVTDNAEAAQIMHTIIKWSVKERWENDQD